MYEKTLVISGLIEKHLLGEMREDERVMLEQWIAESENNRVIFDQLNDTEWVQGELKKLGQYKRIGAADILAIARERMGGMEEFDNSTIRQFDNDDEFENLKIRQFENGGSSTGGIEVPENDEEENIEQGTRNDEFRRRGRVKRIQIFKWVAAASIIGFVVWGLWFVVSRDGRENIPVAVTPVEQDIAPGKEGAILTLADGRTIVLDNAADGRITESAIKSGGKVSYVDADQTEVEYNTMSTPKGRQFSLVLSDGTQVWLNAASSIRYPTVFVGNRREVEITGEAFFEVNRQTVSVNRESSNVKGEYIPFIVKVNGMEVEVLGTQFNINAYDDEPVMSTTLLEGKVRVRANRGDAILKPGEQAIAAEDAPLKIQAVNTDEIIGWKEGRFHFENTDLRTILRQFARWYDVEVTYENGISNRKFFAVVSKNTSLAEVLKLLKANDIHFKIEGRRLTVMN